MFSRCCRCHETAREPAAVRVVGVLPDIYYRYVWSISGSTKMLSRPKHLAYALRSLYVHHAWVEKRNDRYSCPLLRHKPILTDFQHAFTGTSSGKFCNEAIVKDLTAPFYKASCFALPSETAPTECIAKAAQAHITHWRECCWASSTCVCTGKVLFSAYVVTSWPWPLTFWPQSLTYRSLRHNASLT